MSKLLLSSEATTIKVYPLEIGHFKMGQFETIIMLVSRMILSFKSILRCFCFMEFLAYAMLTMLGNLELFTDVMIH